MIQVAVAGALGRMGQAVIEAVQAEDDLQVVAGIDIQATGAASVSGGWLLCNRLDEALERVQPRVLVDFTVAEAAAANALEAVNRGVSPVVGTTGMNAEQLQALRDASRQRQVGAFVAPNFALGAVLMMHFARIAARYFDSAEVIELHHDRKIDAPSGTAVKTAQDMLAARGQPFRSNSPTKEPLPGARGGELGGVRIHSVRLPGLDSHQEVIFGGQGQTLTLRHDTLGASAFMPGILIAIRQVLSRNELVVGLDELLGLT